MMPIFSALHSLAAQRGEGLRPELVRLLERSRRAVDPGEGETSEAAVTNDKAPQRVRNAA